jgi:hypothetical protein
MTTALGIETLLVTHWTLAIRRLSLDAAGRSDWPLSSLTVHQRGLEISRFLTMSAASADRPSRMKSSLRVSTSGTATSNAARPKSHSTSTGAPVARILSTAGIIHASTIDTGSRFSQPITAIALKHHRHATCNRFIDVSILFLPTMFARYRCRGPRSRRSRPRPAPSCAAGRRRRRP